MSTLKELIAQKEALERQIEETTAQERAEVIAKIRAETRKVVTGEQFKTAMTNIGDEVAYLDAPDFAKFWDADAKLVEQAVASIGKVQG